MSKLPSSATLYLTAIGLLALLVGALLLPATPIPSRDQFVLALMLTGLLTATLIFPLRFAPKTNFSLHTSVLFAATLLFPPGIALVIAGVGTLLADLLRREPPEQTLFNSSQFMLQVAAGGTILRAVGWTAQPLALTRPAIVGRLIVVAASMHLIEAVTVSGIVALQTGQPVRRVWRHIVSFDVLDMVGQYALGLVGMIVAAAQPWALPLLLPLGVLLYRSSQRYIQLHAQSAAFAHQAFHDPLTDLPNRALFLDRLQQALRRAERAADGVGVLFLDLDDFKAINDQFGHAAGDLVLQTVAQRLNAYVRPGDTVARLSGDEFVVLLDLVPSVAAAHHVAARITASMQEPIILHTQPVQVTTSIGLALSRAATTEAAAFLHEADQALYQAKAGGKARAAVYHPHTGEPR